jgi:hypothetical protein
VVVTVVAAKKKINLIWKQYKHNEELHKLYSSPNIFNESKDEMEWDM